MLKNKVYLHLLAFYNNKKKPSYQSLSREIDVSRQTISKKIQELINNNIVTIENDNTMRIKNVMQIDEVQLREVLQQRIYNPTKLAKILIIKDDKVITDVELAKQCGVSRALYYNNECANGTFIYGIVSEGQLKYVGSTDNLIERIKQHIKRRPFLKPDNFIILKQISLNGRYQDELDLIHILRPEWNDMGCQ